MSLIIIHTLMIYPVFHQSAGFLAAFPPSPLEKPPVWERKPEPCSGGRWGGSILQSDFRT